MAAIQHDYQRPVSPLPGIIAVVLLALLVGIIGRVLLSSHATDRHGTDAVAVRQCIQQSGPMERWQRLEDPNIEYWMCKIADGRWCVMIAQVFPSIVMGSDYRERSSFCPAGGKYAKVLRYLEQFSKRIR